MSKECIYPNQFAHVKRKETLEDAALELNDAQLQELSELYEGMSSTYQPGKIVKGTVIRADSDGVLVDINFKSRGFIPKFEFGVHELKNFQAGQDIEVLIDSLESPEGNVVLSYEKAKAMRAWDDIMKLFEEGKPVEGVVTHKVKGGLNVDIGIPAFLPGSQIDVHRVNDFDSFLGQTITAHILKVNRKRGNVIVSRRKYINETRAGSRKKVLDTLSIGQVIQGVVKNITNYGVFIDIGGVDGLLHVTDMTWGRIAHPSELVKIGETVAVKVLSFDKDNEKISLGLKQLAGNPWADIESRFKVGEVITGKISSITDYGLFVEVAKDIEGLVHISEVSWTDRIHDLNKLYKTGEEIKVRIVSVDQENRRMSLSIKQLEKNPWESVDTQFTVGQKIKGAITNVTDFGIFVQLLPGIDGLVHISDLSWTEHIDHPKDHFKTGDVVEAVILSVDKDNKKISLGVKQLQTDPWEKVEQDYPLNAIVEGEIIKTTNFGAFVRLATGIEALIHNAELAGEKGKRAEDLLKVGQKDKFRVVNVNKEDRKLALSMKLEPDTTPAPKPAAEKPAERASEPRRTEKPAARPDNRPARSFDKAQDRQDNRPARQQAPKEAVERQQDEKPKTKSAFQIALETAMNDKKDKND